MKKKIVLLPVIALCLLTAACSQGKTLRFGTGNSGGTYYKYGTQLSKGLSEEGVVAPEVKETAGSAANLRLISEGFLQLAVTQGDVLSDAAQGSGVFEGKDYSGGYGALAALYTEACQIIVPKDSPVQSPADLAGLRVSVGEKESGVRKNAQDILLACGLTTEMIQAEYLSFTDSAAALEAGTIDAFFCTAGAPTAAMAELASRMEIRLLPLEERIMSNIQNVHNGYTRTVIPAGTYPGQNEPVSTLGVKAVLIASGEMKSEDAAKITRFLLEHREELCRELPVLFERDLSYVTQDIPCGFHEGAKEVYEEMGIHVEAAEAGSGNTVTGKQDQ